MSDREPPLFPPRLRNWKKGTVQVGVFVRTATGGRMSMVSDRASETQTLLVLAAMRGGGGIPENVLGPLIAFMRKETSR